jgi:AraC-like DNA-binding protein
MDVMSEWLTRTRTAPASSARTYLHGPFGLRFATDATLQFHVVLEGAMWLQVGDDARQLGQGDVVVLPRGAHHVLRDAPTTPVVDFATVAPPPGPVSVQPELVVGSGTPRRTMLCGWFRFDPSAPNPVLDALPDVLHVPAPRGGSGLRATVGLLVDEMTEERHGARAVVDALVDVVLVHAIRAAADHDTAVCPQCWFDALADPVTVEALALLHEQPDRPWTVDSLAAEVGLSRATFARRFRDRVGEPPGAYLTRWRMVLASERLRMTSEPLDTIARSVGYESGFALSRAFKRVLGRTPTQVRQLAKG